MKALWISLFGALCTGLPLLDPPRHYNDWAWWGIFSCFLSFLFIFLYLILNYNKYFGEETLAKEREKENI